MNGNEGILSVVSLMKNLTSARAEYFVQVFLSRFSFFHVPPVRRLNHPLGNFEESDEGNVNVDCPPHVVCDPF